MSEDQDKIIQKIKKLLNIVANDASSDGDIHAAMNAVHGLMNRHHLTEEDLAKEPAENYKVVDDAEMGRARSFASGKLYAWEQDLAVVVSQFVGVPLYVDKTVDWARHNGILLRDWYTKEPWRGISFVFYGVLEDALIARELFNELRILIASTAWLRYAQVYRLEGGAYCEGFVQGLRKANLKEKEQEKRLASTPTALILIARRDDLVKYKQDKAKDYLENKLKMKLGQGSGLSGSSGSFGARVQGSKDGMNTSMTAARSKKLN